jgi:hypothetical protein
MPNSPSESTQAERAADAEDVPSLDQLRWMLRNDGDAAVALEPGAAGKSAQVAGSRVDWPVTPARLCGGLVLLTIAAAAIALIRPSHPIVPAAVQSAVAPAPSLPVPSLPKLAAASKPTPAAPVSPAPVSPAPVPLVPVPLVPVPLVPGPLVLGPAAPAQPSAVAAAEATSVPDSEGAMSPAPWAIAPTLSLLARDVHADQNPAIETPTQGGSPEHARPPQVMADTAVPAPVRARQQPSPSVSTAHRAATRLAFRHHHPHGHRIRRAQNWPNRGYLPSGDGLSYYFVRGSARTF